MAKWKRFVVGPDANGKSAVLMHDATNVQEDPGIFYRATLWSTAEVPVDNTIAKDRSLDPRTASWGHALSGPGDSSGPAGPRPAH
jgi:hypothetical protein